MTDAVLHSLRGKVELVGTRPRQLDVFDRPDRDERGWVMSVAHVVLVLRAAVVGVLARRPDVRLQPADDVSGLPYDHDEIVRLAAEHVRREHALRRIRSGCWVTASH